MKNTVFANNSKARVLQKQWLAMHRNILFRTVDDEKSEFVLVTPNDSKGKIARTQFIDVNEFNSDMGIYYLIKNRICDYVHKNNGNGKLVVIFMNTKGGISYYTIQ